MIQAVFAAWMIVTPSLDAQTIDWDRTVRKAAEAEQHRPIKPLAAQAISPPAQAAYEKYYVAALEHRLAVFTWQAFAAKIIFWMVLFLVLSGSAFSAIQFYFSIRRGTIDVPHEVELSTATLKFRSQFLGVVTLALSLAFFYLYLTNVYPIVNIETTSATVAAK